MACFVQMPTGYKVIFQMLPLQNTSIYPSWDMLSITGTRWNLSSLHQKHWGPPKLHCWNIELWWKRKTYSIYWQSQVFCKGNTNSYSSWKNKTRNPIPHEHQAHHWTFEMICFDLICVAMKSLPFSFPPSP